MKNKTKKLVLAALFAAITCAGTLITIPVPMTNGYVNLGDCVVLLSGWILCPAYGFLAAAIGSSLADLILGFGVYAPATFVIKGLMALTAYFVFKLLAKNRKSLFPRIVSALASEIIMVSGYIAFETFTYGFGGAIVNVVGNIVQGAFGIIAGTLLINAFVKKKLI